MKVHILGLGSVGSLLATHLRRALPKEHQVFLLHRSEKQAVDAFSSGGAITIEHNGVPTTTRGFLSEVFDAYNPPGPLRSPRPHAVKARDQGKIDSLFITTKAHHTVSAIQQVVGRITPNSTIVLMQNGMGVYEELIDTTFRNPRSRPHFILASNTHGVYRQSSYKFIHAGLGNIVFGIVPDQYRDYEAGHRDESVPLSERNLRLTDILQDTDDPDFDRYKSLRNTVASMLLLEDLNVSWQPIADVQTAMRQKLVINSIINPLTALMNCKNGDIFNIRASKRISSEVCAEASAVFAAQLKAEAAQYIKANVADDHDVENTEFQRLPRNLSKHWLQQETHRVAQLTGGNVSSMLADIRAGRDTEIDYMNGYLMKLGRAFNVSTPTTSTLANLVRLRRSIPLDQNL